MRSPIVPILWAQWRVMTNFRVRGAVAARALAVGATLLWYVVWLVIGWVAGTAARGAEPRALAVSLPWFVLFVCGYWQLMPLATAYLGATLDLRRLLAWPIPERSLFAMEAALRLTTAFEMVVFMIVAGAGLARNPAVPAWGPALAVPVLVVFNLFLAAGIRSVLERVFARKWLREAAIFALVLATAVPQLLFYTGAGGAVRQYFRDPSILWPWTAAARLALGEQVLASGAVAALWIAAANVFGRRQFRRSLSFDLAAVQSSAKAPARQSRLYRLPSLVFRDPLAALLEKELRTLARAPRFRLVFLMGFSFGFLIWLPMLREQGFGAAVKGSYPVYVALYGMVLLAEVAVWNSFGFDRSAARLYFAAPVPLATVLAAKNLATVAVVILEAACIAAVCAVLPLGIPASRLVETFFVAIVFSIYLTATGNLSSVYYPRPVNPEHSWGRQSGTRFQLYVLFLFPVLLAPVLLAYGARYAFDSEAAFYGTLALAAVLGLIYYSVALDSAIEAAGRRRELLLAKLSESSGPVASD